MNLEATSGAIPALVPAPVYKTVVEDGKTFQLIPRTVTNTVGHSYTSASYNWINSALQSGVDMRAAGGFSAVSGLLITPIKVIFVGAMDTISHAAKTAAKTLLLPVRSIHWVFAKNVPSPVKLVGDILAEAYRGVATAIATVPLAALSIPSPSAASSLAKAINLTPAKREETTVVEDKVEFVPETTIPQPVAVPVKVQGVWGKIRSSWVGQKVAAHPYIATVAGLAVAAGIVVYGPTAYSAFANYWNPSVEDKIKGLEARLNADLLDDAAVTKINAEILELQGKLGSNTLTDAAAAGIQGEITALQNQLETQNTMTDVDHQTLSNKIKELNNQLATDTLTDAEFTQIQTDILALNGQLRTKTLTDDQCNSIQSEITALQNENAKLNAESDQAQILTNNNLIQSKQEALGANKLTDAEVKQINENILAKQALLNADKLSEKDVTRIQGQINEKQNQLDADKLTDAQAKQINDNILAKQALLDEDLYSDQEMLDFDSRVKELLAKLERENTLTDEQRTQISTQITQLRA